MSKNTTIRRQWSPTTKFIYLFIYLFIHTTTSSLLAEAINVEVNMVDE